MLEQKDQTLAQNPQAKLLNTNQKITKLRQLMTKENLTAYYINTADPHQSEYIAEHYQSRSWFTGFTGSAGYALVTLNEALLWVDGRYFIQAAKEIENSEFKLMKIATSGFPTLEEWLLENLDSGDTLGLNGQLISQKFYQALSEKLLEKNIKIKADFHLVEDIWQHRPSKLTDPVYLHELKYTGLSAAEKIAQVRVKMSKDGAEAALYAGLNDIAWLFNIRGNDVKHTPVAMAFALITQDKALLYIDQNKVNDQVRSVLQENNVTIRDYEQIYLDLKDLSVSTLVLDKSVINHSLYSTIPEKIKIIEKKDYPYLMKACLNEVELKNQRNSYLKDSVALTKFIHYIKQNVESNNLTELSVEKTLHNFRQEQDLFLDESFATIAAYGPNAAMMHYSASQKSHSKIEPKGYLLVDSGGHYLDGTTDVTRTIACGELTTEEIKDYTLTLKAHIGLARAKFLQGVTGYYLDVLARQPLWQHYMDYKSGTGHGVGYLLGVHEGPQRFNMHYANVPLKEGMVITNEPGVYKEGKHGIRLENDYVILKDKKVDTDQFMYLDCLSFVPFDKKAIDTSMLEKFELEWLNDYHQQVYEKISPFLNPAEKSWLKKETAEME